MFAPYLHMPAVGRRTRRLAASWNQKNLRSLRRLSRWPPDDQSRYDHSIGPTSVSKQLEPYVVEYGGKCDLLFDGLDFHFGKARVRQ
jgi:hypothetical protein